MEKHISKWVVFDPKLLKRVRTVTIVHQDNLLYKELDPFDAKLKSEGLAAQEWKSLNQSYLKGKSFREKLVILGWQATQFLNQKK